MHPDSTLIEPRFKEALDRYANEGKMPGGFLSAVLSNNLAESFKRADASALENLPHILAYCYWEIPDVCWGSPEKVGEWVHSVQSAAVRLDWAEAGERPMAETAAQEKDSQS